MPEFPQCDCVTDWKLQFTRFLSVAFGEFVKCIGDEIENPLAVRGRGVFVQPFDLPVRTDLEQIPPEADDAAGRLLWIPEFFESKPCSGSIGLIHDLQEEKREPINFTQLPSNGGGFR